MSVICNEEKKVFDILFATANRLPSLIWQGRRSVKLGEAHLWVTVLDVDIPRRLQGRHEAQKNVAVARSMLQVLQAHVQ